MAPWHQSRVMTLLVLVLAAVATFCDGMQQNWTHWGGDNNNRRFSDHSCIDFSKGKFQKKWSFPAGGSVVGTPAVCGNGIYFNTADGEIKMFKLDTSGKQIWMRTAKSAIPSQASVGIRSAPILSADCKTVYWTTQWTQGSWIIALNTANGNVIYAKKFDGSDMSRITQSGVLWNGVIYIGASSMTEGGKTSNTKFRGTMFALNAASGTVKWSRTVCPAGYTGCAIWGSSPSIDVRRNQVCVGTGNNYEVPASVKQCVINAGGDFNKQRDCLGAAKATNLVDAMICFDMASGNIKWSRTINGVDMYLPGNFYGPDEDFAQGPIIIHKADTNQDILVATSKSSRPIGFDPKTGATKWTLSKLDSGAYAQFGSCTNNKAYCVGLFWYSSKKGKVVCLDPLSGKTISTYTVFDGGVYGPLTCTQKYVFVPRFDGPGSLVAVEIATGKAVGSFSTGHTLFCGPAIVKGVAYVGSGYNANGGERGQYLHAVSLPLNGAC